MCKANPGGYQCKDRALTALRFDRLAEQLKAKKNPKLFDTYCHKAREVWKIHLEEQLALKEHNEKEFANNDEYLQDLDVICKKFGKNGMALKSIRKFAATLDEEDRNQLIKATTIKPPKPKLSPEEKLEKAAKIKPPFQSSLHDEMTNTDRPEIETKIDKYLLAKEKQHGRLIREVLEKDGKQVTDDEVNEVYRKYVNDQRARLLKSYNSYKEYLANPTDPADSGDYQRKVDYINRQNTRLDECSWPTGKGVNNDFKYDIESILEKEERKKEDIAWAAMKKTQTPFVEDLQAKEKELQALVSSPDWHKKAPEKQGQELCDNFLQQWNAQKNISRLQKEYFLHRSGKNLDDSTVKGDLQTML